MPVYTEPFSTEFLLNNLNESDICKNIFILGCPICANLSCNMYHGKKEPVMNLFLKALSMEKEIFNLKNTLKNNNFIVDSNLSRGTSLCALTNNQRKKIVKLTQDYDTIIVMSCPAGLSTITSTIPNKNIISGMKLKGFKSIKPKIKGFNFFIDE